MKKLFLILIIASLGWSLSAQEDTLSWKQTLQRHDIQIGFGDPLVVGFQTDNIYLFGECYTCVEHRATDWFTPDTYSSGRIPTPSFSVGYKYRLAKWFWLGGTVSYTGFHETTRDRVSNKKAASRSTHFISIIPSVRFSWLNKKYVTLYSGVGIGFAIEIDKWSYSKEFYPYLYNSREIYIPLTGQLTFVGVHVGRKWYGFTEIGIGPQGIIQAGFGYNFNSKQK